MCDCYDHKCKKCDTVIPMHLSDFNTDRNEVDVYCDKHIPKNRLKGCLWFVMSSKECEYEYDRSFGNKHIFVKALTVNAKTNCDGNHPNVGDPVLVERFGKKKKKV